ncbi:MAG: DUF6713 family protein [Verrucomicrobiota bacterium]
MDHLLPICFSLSLCLLFCHELDATQKKEWKLLYGLRNLDDALAERLFLLLHIPMFLFGFWAAAPASPIEIKIGFAVFCIIHALLHLRLRLLNVGSFNSFTSRLFIDGSAGFALVFLVLWSISESS